MPRYSVHGEHVVMDRSTSAIEYGRANIHSHVFTGVSSGSSVLVLVRNLKSETPSHLDVRIAGNGEWIVDTYEGPTISSDGSLMVTAAINRVHPRQETVDVFHGPTVSADGTQLSTELIPGNFLTSGISNEALSLLVNGGGEILMRLTNNAGTAGDVGIKILSDQARD